MMCTLQFFKIDPCPNIWVKVDTGKTAVALREHILFVGITVTLVQIRENIRFCDPAVSVSVTPASHLTVSIAQ